MSNEEKRAIKAMEREKEQEYLALIEENKRIIYKVCYLYAADEEAPYLLERFLSQIQNC